ncbi:MAG TPA: hypothetical protein VFP84_13065 [Kofleriaceae bacterium]|nr:hypothetical protein [Kofleriaceae bacterium]
MCGWKLSEPAPPPSPEQLRKREEAEREQAALRRSHARNLMITGAALFAVGAIITAVTFSSASSPSGGTYLVAYGPMFAGVIRFVRGVAAPR